VGIGVQANSYSQTAEKVNVFLGDLYYTLFPPPKPKLVVGAVEEMNRRETSSLPLPPGTRARLFGYLRRVRFLYVGSLVLLFGISALTALKAWIIQPVTDAFLRGGTTERQWVATCAIVAGIFLVQAVLTYGYATVSKTAGARMVRAIREDLFSHLLEQDRRYFLTRPSSDLTSRLINDVVHFEYAAAGSVQSLVQQALTVLMLFSVMMVLDWKLAILSIALLSTTGYILSVMQQRIRQLSRRAQEMISSLVNHLTELIGGMEVVLTFRAGDRWRRRFENVNADYYESALRLNNTTAAVVSLIQVVSGLGIALILWVTGHSLLSGEMTEGQFLSFLATLYLLQAPVTGIGTNFLQLTRGLAASERAFEVLDERPALRDPASPLSLPPEPLAIEFRNVTFTYESIPVLRDVSFTIEPGELVVLVGESGAGKTTVGRLLLRFYDPTAGQVLLGGVPLPELNRESLYRRAAYVSQEVFLFQDSIRENLLIGAPDATDEEMVAALRQALLDDEFLAELPDGLDSEVGERGARLSGGQRQRLAIARALLSDPQILILDEATSALDMDTERELLRRLFDPASGRTIIAVTHRLSVAQSADRILSLKDGRLAEDGPAQVLSQLDGEFARLQRTAYAGRR
jgi:ATP-binding cassette, subfamily B, bacterial MsbA